MPRGALSSIEAELEMTTAAGGVGLDEHLKRMRRRSLDCDGREEYTRLSTPIRGDKAVKCAGVLPCEPDQSAPHPIKRHQHKPSPFHMRHATALSIQCCSFEIGAICTS